MQLCEQVREIAFSIHRYLRHGHLEKVYHNALIHRLRKAGVEVEGQRPIHVFDEDGTPLGHYFADLLVGGQVLVELKASRDITPDYLAQLFGYMRASRFEHGLLINFGAPKFQIRKLILDR